MTKAAAIPNEKLRLAKMLKALGNPIRFQIVETLAERQMCITAEIVESTPLAQSTVSQHLKVLKEAGLIHGDIEGPATCYCLEQREYPLAQRTDRRLAGRCCYVFPALPLPQRRNF
jgi:ArsR family transcriptional regulator